MRVIERNARVQSQMVEELLDVSRIATGRVRLSVSDVEVARLIDAALESVRPAAEAKNVALTTEIDAAARMARADARRLQQIIWNLLSNAVRFTPAGGPSTCVTRPADPGFLEIVVSDTGCGIVPEFLPHVFERFRRPTAARRARTAASVLALAIVHDLVEMHGGSVRAESPGDGQGTTFTVRLPAAVPREAADTPVSTHRLPQRLIGATVSWWTTTRTRAKCFA